MTTDLASRITELTATIEARLHDDEEAARDARRCAEVKDGRWFDGEDEINDDNGLRLATVNHPFVTTHIARHDPARVLRDVTATRALVAEILALPHDYRTELARHLTQPDPCGRDQRVARLLSIIASEEEQT